MSYCFFNFFCYCFSTGKSVRNENFANIDKMPKVPASSPQLRLSDEVTSFNNEQDNSVSFLS